MRDRHKHKNRHPYPEWVWIITTNHLNEWMNVDLNFNRPKLSSSLSKVSDDLSSTKRLSCLHRIITAGGVLDEERKDELILEHTVYPPLPLAERRRVRVIQILSQPFFILVWAHQSSTFPVAQTHRQRETCSIHTKVDQLSLAVVCLCRPVLPLFLLTFGSV